MPGRSVKVVPVSANSSVSSLLAAFCVHRSVPGRWSVLLPPGVGSSPRRRAGGLWRTAPWPQHRRDPSSPGGDQFEEQLVELGDQPGVVLTQGSASVDQDPKHRELLVVPAPSSRDR
jgi:hypothetical protein